MPLPRSARTYTAREQANSGSSRAANARAGYHGPRRFSSEQTGGPGRGESDESVCPVKTHKLPRLYSAGSVLIKNWFEEGT